MARKGRMRASRPHYRIHSHIGPQIAKKWNVNDVIAAHIRAYEPPKPTPNEMYNNMISNYLTG